MILTSTGSSRAEPTGRTAFSCSTRSSFAWSSGTISVISASRHVVALGGNAHEAGGELVEQEDRGAQLERVIGKHSDAALLQQVHVRHDDREGETRRGNLRPEVARESEKGRPVPARQRFDRGAQPRDVGLAE